MRDSKKGGWKQYLESATGCRPNACFLISEDFEDCLRTSVSIGGDTDTLCAISCAAAEAFYGITAKLHDRALAYLDKRLLKLYNKYYRQSTKII